MCLTILPDNKTPHYTTQNMKVYKRLRRFAYDKYKAPFYNFVYSTNQLYESELRLNSVWMPEALFTTTLNPKGADIHLTQVYNRLGPKGVRDINVTEKCRISLGFHAYTDLEKAARMADYSFNRGELVVECLIPPHSWYYYGTNNEIVSDKIIITDKILYHARY